MQTPNLNLGELLVMTKGGTEARERVLAKIDKLFDTGFPNVRGRANRLENGPPVGYPVQFRVYGNDNTKVREIAGQVAEIMRANPHVRRVNQDWGERVKRVQVDVDQDKARALGVSSFQIKQALEASLSGTPITQYREEDQGIDVVARLVAAERTDLNNLKDAKIYVRDGKFVPVSQVARLTLDSEESELWRRNRIPTLTVRARRRRRPGAGRDRRPAAEDRCARQAAPARLRHRSRRRYRVEREGPDDRCSWSCPPPSSRCWCC